MKLKVIFVLLNACFVSYSSFSQRVKRKGTTPIELNKQASGVRKIGNSSFTLAQVQGKWQEYKRTAIGSAETLAFTDTLMLRIDQDNAELREGMSMNMKGEALIEDNNTLIVAGDSYTIMAAGNELVLNDGEFIKTLKKISVFYLETVGKDSIREARYTSPDNISLSNIQGKWSVYRRKAKPGIIDRDTELIKSLSIIKDSTVDIATGEIVLYKNDITEKLKCIITVKENTLLITAENKQWTFLTYKADNDEFVFGKENEVLNYAKRF